MHHNYVLRLAYDGTDYFGWQKTKMGPSIEASLQACLEKIAQKPIALQAASRTDRGVHAEDQWVNFFSDTIFQLEALHASLNSLLPPTIRVLSIQEMPFDFHPTLHALAKEYHFRITLGPFQLPQDRYWSWHVPYLLDLNKMEEASRHFLGQHDFSSFCNMRKQMNVQDKIRKILDLSIHQIDSLSSTQMTIRIKGTRFLYKMVRNLVGTLISVGRGKIEPHAIPLILKTASRKEGGMTAPAHGLTLKKVYYPEQFIPVPTEKVGM